MHRVKTRRSYNSPLRLQAQVESRKAIVAAAASLFVEQGYARTTVDQIARRAGVSRPTVFAVGTKAHLLALARQAAIAGEDETLRDGTGDFEEILATTDAAELLARFAQMTAGIARRWGPLHAVLQEGARSDPELAALWETNQSDLHVCARRVVDALDARGVICPGLSLAAAADIVWLLIEPSQYQKLVGTRRWSHRAFERWQASTMIDQLLGGGSAAAG